jgi:hypothetical protein
MQRIRIRGLSEAAVFLLITWTALLGAPALWWETHPRHVEERRLGNHINEELNQYLAADRRFGGAQSAWDASEGTVMLLVYGVTTADNQQAVCDWVAAKKREQRLYIKFQLEFYEDNRKAADKRLRTIEL